MLDSLALRILGVVCLIVGIAFGSLYYGHTRYKEGVRVTKLEWDTDRATWQHALDKQKHDALAMLISAQADVDTAKAKAAKAAQQQEKDYATYMAGTAALAKQYAARSLRYAAPSPARCGASSGTTVSSAASSADASSSSIFQLPDPIAGNLRQFATDAENLRNDYRKCVAAVSGGPSL